VFVIGRDRAFDFRELKVRGIQMRPSVRLMLGVHRLRVTHYALSLSGSEAPLGWELECQTAKDTWVTVDVRRDVPATREIRTIELAEPVECQMLRILCIPSGAGDPPILHGFDVFGTILN
jgi:hypothetical protein